MRSLVATACISAAVLGASAAHGNVLTNGDFEATPFDSGWTANFGTPLVGAGSGLAPGSTTAAYLRPGAQYVWQTSLSGPTSPLWSFEMLFASEAIGVDGGTAANRRLLQVGLQHAPESSAVTNEGQINLIINDTGTVQVFSGSSTANTIISGLTIQPTVDANGNNSFSDPGDTLHVYKLIINGDYSSSASTARLYNVSVVDVATGATIGSSGNVGFYQNSLPGPGGIDRGIYAVELTGNNTRHTYAVDSLSLTNVPEPATAALLLGGASLLVRRRRSASVAK